MLNARLLWTFAGAYRIFGDEKYKELADRAFNYIVERFWDLKNGGGFWMLHADGSVEDDTKMTYGQGFFVVCVLRVRPRNGQRESTQICRYDDYIRKRVQRGQLLP